MSSEPDPDTPRETIDAQSLVDALRRYEAMVPDFQQLSNAQIIALRKAATLDPEWVTIAVAAIDVSTTVQTALGTSSAELLREIGDINRWTAVEGELDTFLRGVSNALLVRRHRVGLKVLQAYGICRQLVRQPEHQDLLPVVKKLEQMNKLGKRKPKGETPDGSNSGSESGPR
jgi:hypothetical protein